MRLFVLAAVCVLGLGAHSAHACPPVEACVVNLKTTVAPPARAPDHVVDQALRAPIETPKRAPGEIEMPWIWKTLREQLYARMPTYEEPHALKIVLSPVVVTSPSDTVPGVGIAGNF